MLNNTKLQVGMQASISRQATTEVVAQLIYISADSNPIHTDNEAAQQAGFAKAIAPGLFCLSIVSTVLGNVLPGNGTIIVAEHIHFLRPVYIGDTVIATLEVATTQGRHATLNFECRNQVDELVATGSVDVTHR